MTNPEQFLLLFQDRKSESVDMMVKSERSVACLGASPGPSCKSQTDSECSMDLLDSEPEDVMEETKGKGRRPKGRRMTRSRSPMQVGSKT